MGLTPQMIHQLPLPSVRDQTSLSSLILYSQSKAETHPMGKLFSPSDLGKIEIPREKKDAMKERGS